MGCEGIFVKEILKLLDYDGRVRELARIIGGTISDFSIEHAKLMLNAGTNEQIN